MFKDKRFLFFDLDGTLIESVGVWNRVDQDLIAFLGGTEAEEAVQARRDELLREFSAAANPYLEYCRALGRAYGSSLSAEEIIARRYQISGKYLTEVIDYKEGAARALKELKSRGLTLVITTTTGQRSVNIYRTSNVNIMKKAPLDEYFSAVYTREDVREIKPNPEVFFRAMEDFGAVPDQCLVFDNSLIGVEAAKNAGLQVAAMYDRYSDPDRAEIDARADFHFHDFGEVLAALERELPLKEGCDGEKYLLEPAEAGDVSAVFALIAARIRWMDRCGIRQWNVTDYLKYYPLEYFAGYQRQGRLWVLRRAGGRAPVAAAILKNRDERWPDGRDACYVHNLVADEGEKGAGAALLRLCEARAARMGQTALRLDCSAGNEKLNRWYESLGFHCAGTMALGKYKGNRLEKTVAKEAREA